MRSWPSSIPQGPCSSTRRISAAAGRTQRRRSRWTGQAFTLQDERRARRAFPTTPDALQPTFGKGPNDAFVAKIDPSQSGPTSLVYSSYLGGSGDENIPSVGVGGNPAGGIAVDSSGNIYVAGNTSSSDLPTANPYQPAYGGAPSDAFVAKIVSSGSQPDFAETATPSSRALAPGGSTTYIVTVSPTAEFTGGVIPDVSGLPSGASASFNPPLISITDSTAQTATMTVMTDGSVAIGTYPLTITATAGGVQHNVLVTLMVVSASNLADLSITNTGSPNPVEINTMLTYSMNVINAGPAMATGVTVSDTLPSGVTFVAVTPTDKCVGTTTITCTFATLDGGTGVAITIAVKPQQAGTVSDTVSVTGDQADPDTSNNSATSTVTAESSTGSPAMIDPSLTVHTVMTGLTERTGIAFLGPDEFLVIEKSTGFVPHVIGGIRQTSPALPLAVNSNSERGLLGIALHPNFATNGYVYLYWTCRGAEAAADCDPIVGAPTTDITQVLLRGNRVDRFIWDGSQLTFDMNLIRLHAYQKDHDENGDFNQPQRGNHNAGKIVFGCPHVPRRRLSLPLQIECRSSAARPQRRSAPR